MKPVGLWSTLARAQNPGESLYVITGRVPPGNPLDGRRSRGIMAPARAPYPPPIKLGVCCSGWVYFQIACCWWFFNIFLCIRVLYVPGLNYSFNEALMSLQYIYCFQAYQISLIKSQDNSQNSWHYQWWEELYETTKPASKMTPNINGLKDECVFVQSTVLFKNPPY